MREKKFGEHTYYADELMDGRKFLENENNYLAGNVFGQEEGREYIQNLIELGCKVTIPMYKDDDSADTLFIEPPVATITPIWMALMRLTHKMNPDEFGGEEIFRMWWD